MLQTSESLSNILPSFLEAQKEIKGLVKNKTVAGRKFQYSYITLDSILDVVKPVLNNHNLMLMQNVHSLEPVHNVTSIIQYAKIQTFIYHTSGEFIATDVLTIRAIGEGTSQDLGSAITYGKRYQLCGLLSISVDEDDDGAMASRQGYAKNNYGQNYKQNYNQGYGQNYNQGYRQQNGNGITEQQRSNITRMYHEKEISPETYKKKLTEACGVDSKKTDELTYEEANRLYELLCKE